MFSNSQYSIVLHLWSWLLYRMAYIPAIGLMYIGWRDTYGANLGSEQVAAVTATIGFIVVSLSAIICYIR